MPKFPIEAIAAYPLPGTNIPGGIQFSPDDKRLAYLYSPDDSLVRLAYSQDLETGETQLLIAPPDGGDQEETLSLEEALYRERLRQRELGITQFAWARKGNRILVPLRGELYIQDGLEGVLTKIVTNSSGPALSPLFSPDGEWVAYVQDAEVYVVSASGGLPRQVTTGARGAGKTNGLAEYIAQEELHRTAGLWWSPDSQWLAFTEVDETHIPIYRIVHQGKDVTGDSAQEDHRYPFAGQQNARVRLGVVSIRGGDPVWMQLEPEEEYLARVNWLPNGGLAVQLENRLQSELRLVRFDPRTGIRTLLLQETNGIWINLHDLFRPLQEDHPLYPGGFIWASEKSGFQHLYLHNRRGDFIRMLTFGKWMVEEIVGVDQERDLVYFTGTRHGVLEKHLYVVSLEGGEPRRLTDGPGIHQVVMDHRMRRFVDTYHCMDLPPTVSLHSVEDGSRIRTLFDRSDPRIEKLGLTPPRIITLENKIGLTLYGAMYLPSEVEYGPGPYPTIVYVYGGPHSQMVSNSWYMTVNMRAQYLRSQGYLVFALDNRGSARRGLAFEGVIRHNLGNYEVQDQVQGVEWLVAQKLADPQRVGIYGWSYGGYMAAMCLARAPHTFRAAVAGAPVTHWDGYDTHYTERYMGLPQSQGEEYRMSSVMHHAPQIKGKLLLVHGLLDENVHFRHTARLINALNREHIPYELLLFPDERHMPRRLEDRVYMEDWLERFFDKALKS